MPDEAVPDNKPTEVVATFTTEEGAKAALAALEAEGIHATVSGSMADPANYSIFERLNDEPIQVLVLRDRAEEARRILEHLDAAPEPGWEDTAEQAIDGWLCHVCDTVVPETETACPECGTPRGEQPPPGQGEGEG